MTTLIKLIIGITLSLTTSSETSYIRSENIAAIASKSTKADTTKVAAYRILDNKCNTCHIKRNKRRVFTLENMTSWADDIYTQVFVKKRMPKGKKIKLTHTEYQQLLTWITTAQNQ